MADNNDKISVDQYGRKKWNLEAYSQDQKKKKKDISGYSLSTNDEFISHREALLKELLDAVKQHTLITGSGVAASTTTTSATKTRIFGFFCPVCEFSFRDNMALIDHFNSPQHIAKIKSSSFDGAGATTATVREVREMLEYLVAQDHAKQQSHESFQERVRKRQEFELGRRQRNQAQRRRKRAKVVKKAAGGGATPIDGFEAAMGFAGFGSTKR